MEEVKKDRRIEQEKRRLIHQPTFDSLGIPKANFMSKMVFVPSKIGLRDKHIGIFPSEIKNKEDVYIEFGDINCVPENIDGYPIGGLVKWRFNPNYHEEYPLAEPETGTRSRFFIPIAELILVTKPDKPKLRTATPEVKKDVERESTSNELASVPPDEIDPLTKEMTMRDYAAIHMRKPCSKKKWLNELITKWND